jgi:hypothetical protein
MATAVALAGADMTFTTSLAERTIPLVLLEPIQQTPHRRSKNQRVSFFGLMRLSAEFVEHHAWSLLLKNIRDTGHRLSAGDKRSGHKRPHRHSADFCARLHSSRANTVRAADTRRISQAQGQHSDILFLVECLKAFTRLLSNQSRDGEFLIEFRQQEHAKTVSTRESSAIC